MSWYVFFILGPNFNVTVGPNGSGKSSIVTALCIALGGDLKESYSLAYHVLKRFDLKDYL